MVSSVSVSFVFGYQILFEYTRNSTINPVLFLRIIFFRIFFENYRLMKKIKKYEDIWMCTISTGFAVGLLLVKTEQKHPIIMKRSSNTTYYLNLESMRNHNMEQLKKILKYFFHWFWFTWIHSIITSVMQWKWKKRKLISDIVFKFDHTSWQAIFFLHLILCALNFSLRSPCKLWPLLLMIVTDLYHLSEEGKAKSAASAIFDCYRY